jgi:MFS family permease
VPQSRVIRLSNVIVLAIAQMLAGSGLTVLVILGGIIGAELAPRPALATAPITISIVAMALSTVPAALIMRRIGRRAGFILAAFIGAAGGGVGAQAVTFDSFELFCLSSVLIGISVAFSQQYRFAAAESVPTGLASRAISYVLIGSLGAALMGPQLALAGRWWFPESEYAGSFVVVSALYALAALVLIRLKLAVPGSSQSANAGAMKDIVARPMFRVAVLASAGGFMVMSFIMTATPISMHTVNHHNVEATTLVIQSHVLAMFLPSLVSGHLIARFGERTIMQWGVALLAACIAISATGQQVMHYWWGLVMLGIGWNFLFVAGTTLLTKTLDEAVRHRGQALNEFTVFGAQAMASLLAGFAVQTFGWVAINLVTLPLLAWMFLSARKVSAPAPRPATQVTAS